MTTRNPLHTGACSPNAFASYFGHGVRIGEAKNPGPGIDDPEDSIGEPVSEGELEHNEEAASGKAAANKGNSSTTQREESQPAPRRISLASLLLPNIGSGLPAQVRISLTSLLQQNTPLDSFLEAINCWLAVMHQRRVACRSDNYNHVAWHEHETSLFENVRKKAISLAQAAS